MIVRTLDQTRGTARRLTAMADFTKDAIDKGATLLTGGSRIGDTGYFWQPTILSDVPLDAKVFNDEPFGPMAAILNENSSSDGDIFPYMFREAGLGQLVGKRSWGGVVGISKALGPIVGGALIGAVVASEGAGAA